MYRIEHITHDWVAGKRFQEITQACFFVGDMCSEIVMDVSNGINEALANSSTLDLATWRRLQTSGLRDN